MKEKEDGFEILDEVAVSTLSFDGQLSRFNQKKVSLERYWFNNVLITINVRLGLKSIPENYFHLIKKCMGYPQFVGLIGGKPNLAFYFVGIQEPNNLIFLDPHLVLKKVDNVMATYEYHKKDFMQDEPRSVHMSKLDPCLGFGFLIKSIEDFNDFVTKLRKDKVADDENSIFSIYQSEKELQGGLE
eukprot:CAMPEP_0170557902 /NCGR_PEP_ID=MMETSP0211-20121228/31108_1 /TAXON_ID=311385 /ORGANISM="Pseudokeronopsis sp., Strain OXSARD2" /LENGTH=185 /DNA_ID=CAMNT_0010869339 /DNA_START=804 /DNA_END=1358 /DNA_ORIENTATION=+